MAPRSSAPLTGTPRRSKPSRTRPVGGPLQCSVSTLRQCSRSDSRIAMTYPSREGHFRSANWVTRWSYDAAHLSSALLSQSDQCTSVPPRSKMTARGVATARNDREPPVRASCSPVPDLSWLFHRREVYELMDLFPHASRFALADRS